MYLFLVTGQDLRNVLVTLRQINGNVYRQLRSEFQDYARCVGVVDTGYFKRSTDAVLPPSRKRFNDLDDVIDINDMQMVYDDLLNR